MTRLTNDGRREKFLDEAVAAAERVSGKKLNQQNRAYRPEPGAGADRIAATC